MSVPPSGYAWWYIDALSDDARYGLTIIAFIGSVFSPYYAFARRNGGAYPANHVAVNVALYGRGARRWTMTERGTKALQQSEDRLGIGPSSLRWDNGTLVIDINEIAVPLPRRVRGQVRLEPLALPGRAFALDEAGAQIWHPIAPRARIEANFSSPALRWQGTAYFDHNRGAAPLEHAFRAWHWSRQTADGTTRILYDAARRNGTSAAIAVEIGADGAVSAFEAPPRRKLRTSLWGIRRVTRSDHGCDASILETLEDTPFYARSLLATSCGGLQGPAMHESLDLDRFSSPIVQAMLAFRMPRTTR